MRKEDRKASKTKLKTDIYTDEVVALRQNDGDMNTDLQSKKSV